SEGPASQCGNDLAGAGQLFIQACGITFENTLAARRGAGRRAVVGPFDEYLPDVWIEGIARNGAGGIHGARKGLVEPRIRQVAGGDESDTDLVEPGLDGNGRGSAAVTAHIADFGIPVVQIDAFAVDRD